MIQKDELQNRQQQGQPGQTPPPMKGQAEADAAIAGMKGQGAKPAADKPDELATLRARIAQARAVAAPSGDNQFAQGCFNRGRDAALSIIDGE